MGLQVSSPGSAPGDAPPGLSLGWRVAIVTALASALLSLALSLTGRSDPDGEGRGSPRMPTGPGAGVVAGPNSPTESGRGARTGEDIPVRTVADAVTHAQTLARPDPDASTRWLPDEQGLTELVAGCAEFQALPDHIRSEAREWIVFNLSGEIAVFDGALPEVSDATRRQFASAAAGWSINLGDRFFRRLTERAAAQPGTKEPLLPGLADNLAVVDGWEQSVGRRARDEWARAQLLPDQQVRWRVAVEANLERGRRTVEEIAKQQAAARGDGR